MRWTIPTAVFKVWPDWFWEITNTVLEDRTQETLNWVWLVLDSSKIEPKPTILENVQAIDSLFLSIWIFCHPVPFKIGKHNFQWVERLWVLKILSYLRYHCDQFVNLGYFIDLLWEKWNWWVKWYEFVDDLLKYDRDTPISELFSNWYIKIELNPFYTS